MLKIKIGQKRITVTDDIGLILITAEAKPGFGWAVYQHGLCEGSCLTKQEALERIDELVSIKFPPEPQDPRD